MRLTLPSIVLALTVSLSFPLASYSQSANPDSAKTVPMDSLSQQKRDQLIGQAKGTILVEPGMKIEIESEFPGGSRAWFNFLNTHLTYPPKAVRKKIEGTVVLQFIVDKDGSVSDLSALNGDPILAEAALKAMAESPRWRPATQNGRVVKSYKKQPIVFRLEASK